MYTEVENEWIGSLTLELLPFHFNTDSDLEPVLKLGVKVCEVEDLRNLGARSGHSFLVYSFSCCSGEYCVVDGVVVHLPVL